MATADEKALTREWYLRAAWLSEAGYDFEAELTEALAESRTHIHQLEKVADEMAAVAAEMSALLRDTINEIRKHQDGR